MAAAKTQSAAGAVVRSLSPQDTKKLLHLVRNSKSIEIKVSARGALRLLRRPHG